MPEPKANMAASARARLLAIAKERGLAFDLVLTRYALERLLDRLSRSAHAGEFALKGAMLVTTWLEDPLRGTRDLDFLGFGDPNPDRVRAAIAEIMAIEVDDGLAFDHAALQASATREDNAYGGVRLRTRATLSAARIPIVIDVAFGDATEPGLEFIDYPVLLDLPRPRIRAYAPETVVAEKLQAMVALGRANSRIKDFYDVWNLTRVHELDPGRLERAIAATFERRGTALPDQPPDALTPAFAEDPTKRRQWEAFTEDLAMRGASLSEIVGDLSDRLMPIIERARRATATKKGATE